MSRPIAMSAVALLALVQLLMAGPAGAAPAGPPSTAMSSSDTGAADVPTDDYGNDAPEPADTEPGPTGDQTPGGQTPGDQTPGDQTPGDQTPGTPSTGAPSTVGPSTGAPSTTGPTATTTTSPAPVTVTVTPTVAPTRPVTVTLDFDDGTADQFQAAELMQRYGMPGVFYINSGRVGLSRTYLSAGQIHQLQQGGNEIGGHTVFHLHLPQQALVEQERQICTDRNQLLGMGFQVTDMALPFGEYTADTLAAARACGYNSVRTSEGASGGSDSLPPADLYAMKALSSLGPATTAAYVEAALQRAQTHGGGLVQLVFHKICAHEPCRSNAIHLSAFTQILDWLAAQRAVGLVTVKTVQQVIGGALRPVVAPPTATARVGAVGVADPSFEQGSLANDAPSCWETTVNGDGNEAAWTPSHDAHSGRWSVHLTATKITGGVGLLVTQDLGSCAAPATVGDRYTYGVWYKSSAPIHLVAYRRLPAGGYLTYGLSPAIAASPNRWSYSSVLTRAVPADTTGISIGVVVQNAGQFTFDDFSLIDSGPVPPRATHTPTTVAPTTAARAAVAAATGEVTGAAPSVPALMIPAVPAAALVPDRTHSTWSGVAWLGALLAVSVLCLLAIDWRLNRIRAGTRAGP